MPDANYPPVGFYFRVSFGAGGASVDNAFQEVSGLTMELETTSIPEGGQNLYKHRVPTVGKYSNLVLKRGLVAEGSDLARWCSSTVGADFSAPIVPRQVLVSLLNEDGNPLASWSFDNAWPVKWSISDFKAQENALAIETLELAYSRFQKV
ncbi:phage tail protein [Hymenobacter sp. BT175]|uniref:phage tail protein n=1 Tax=Hymenobacter translucens TaxID=2886507 RepID=UPI001D0EE181|nr:phage tail protein [Hymenobacter translucens]MCC2545353.1 phage tail protein [Hymenobacter translucens]